tara:strand:+ start:120 stop:500 length:381 start_codon:yes stop_codon:yes gene_type:complete
MALFKRLKISFYIIFFTVSCSLPEKNCELFKTGSFEFRSIIEGKEYVSNFIRTENSEVEFFQGSVDTSSVRWVSDCEFILKNINPKKSKISISMKILSTYEDSYMFEYSVVGDNSNIKRGKAVKLD